MSQSIQAVNEADQRCLIHGKRAQKGFCFILGEPYLSAKIIPPTFVQDALDVNQIL